MLLEFSDAGALEFLYQRYTTTQVANGGASLKGDATQQPYLRRLIQRHLPEYRETRILELGCGSGDLLRLLTSLGYKNAAGVDSSPEQIQVATASGGADVRLGTALEALKALDDSSIDVLVAFDVLEHLALGQLLSVVAQAHRVLRRGGRFIVHVPNGAAILGPAVFYGDLTHRTCFTTRSLQQLFSAFGFAEIRLEEDAPTVHGPMSLVRWLAWKMIRTLAWAGHLVESGSTRRGAVFSQGILAVAIR